MTTDLIDLRHTLSALAEPSGTESRTASFLRDFLSRYHPTQLVSLPASHGLVAVYESREPGPTLLFRADMDALVVDPATAQGRTAAHRCGHDGHMTMLLGLAMHLALEPPKRGKIALLFQPAEETGIGAKEFVESGFFQALKPDVALGLHNVPGYPLGEILLRPGTFALASLGLRISLHGRSAHAGEAEKGHSPKNALAELLKNLPSLAAGGTRERCTVTYAQLGEPGFGISPGEATLHVTLRADQDKSLHALEQRCRHLINEMTLHCGLGVEIEVREPFPATVNDETVVGRAHALLQAEGHTVRHLESPFFWSEDFGNITAHVPGMLFGLGAGETQPPLHDSRYEFPDALLSVGVSVWRVLAEGLAR